MIRAGIYCRSCLIFICLICGIKPVFLTHRHCSRKENRLYWQAACKILDGLFAFVYRQKQQSDAQGKSWESVGYVCGRPGFL